MKREAFSECAGDEGKKIISSVYDCTVEDVE